MKIPVHHFQTVKRVVFRAVKTKPMVWLSYPRTALRPWYLRDAILLSLSAIGFLCLFILYTPQPVRTGSLTPRRVIIRDGMGVREIGTHLKEEGLIDRASDFVFLAELRGLDKRLQAGRYELSPGMSLMAILDNLSRGKTAYYQVTIPEGLTATQMASLLQREASLDSAKFMRLVNDSKFCALLGIEAESLEGYLFPDTYNIYWHVKEKDLIRRLVFRFKEVFNEKFEKGAKAMGFSKHQVVTLASIIEKEAQVDEERPIISAVFHNRLRLGRPLQADPTVLYALGEDSRKLLKRDLRVKSPYNTYLHPGLPPGPICSPGQASIEAALYPADVDYLYFVAKGNGTHIFTRSHREHVQAKMSVHRREF